MHMSLRRCFSVAAAAAAAAADGRLVGADIDAIFRSFVTELGCDAG